MTNPFDFFKKSFYINLDDRIDRKEHITEQLENYNIVSERFSAVRLSEEESERMTQNGSLLCEDVSDEDPIHRDRIKKVTLGQRSCAMSHLNIYQRAKNDNIDNVLIFEDDMIFNPNVDVIDILTKTIEELKNVEWDIFFLGCIPTLPMSKRGDYLYELTDAYTTHSYAVNKSCYDTLLDFSFNEGFAIDNQLTKLSSLKKIKMYTSKHPLTFQKENFSDIQMLSVKGLEKDITERYKIWTE